MAIRKKQSFVVFSDLVQLVEGAAESANDPVFGKEALHKCDSQKSGFSSKSEHSTHYAESSGHSNLKLASKSGQYHGT